MLYEFLQVDKQEQSLLYEQLYKRVIAAIESGDLVHGDKLPSIRTLAADLNVSRTTVETAYDQLCAEGYINNKPKKGFFVEAEIHSVNIQNHSEKQPIKNDRCTNIKYDFSGSSLDPQYIDLKYWKRCLKDILDKPSVISSYGDPQGEKDLREILCDYAKKLRGVNTSPDNIIIGAGTQTLMSFLPGIMRDYGNDVFIEKGFFPQGEQIFCDFGYRLNGLSADRNGIIVDDSTQGRILFVNSSGSNRGSAPLPYNKRMEIIGWAERNNAIIIEDDYNGELRYTSKPVPALQSMNNDRVIYIGSFSKLLLPSVRIGYMVLPDHLLKLYEAKKHNYNQTASKTEQLALAEYINLGRLDRQLRKLRKIYAVKSELLLSALRKHFGGNTIIETVETALCVRLKIKTSISLDELKNKAKESGIRIGKCREKNGLKYIYLSFAGIATDKLEEAAEELYKVWADILL